MEWSAWSEVRADGIYAAVNTVHSTLHAFRGADNNVHALRSDWFILTADFWLDELAFSPVWESRFAIAIGWKILG